MLFRSSRRRYVRLIIIVYTFFSIILLEVTPTAKRNTLPFRVAKRRAGDLRFSVATFFVPIPRVEALRTSTLGYEIATPTELPGVRTVCGVLPMPLSGVKSLFTLMGRLGWGTLLVTFVVEFVSSSNSVGVALPQLRVAGVVRYPG